MIKMKNFPTPKTLSEAINNGIEASMEMHTHLNMEMIESHIKDFLAQKFATAVIQAKDGEGQVLRDLFATICEKNPK